MSKRPSVRELFDLTGRVAMITGGAGLLGLHHAQAIAEMGGCPVLVDLDGQQAQLLAEEIAIAYDVRALGITADITQPQAVTNTLSRVLDTFGSVDVLINNAAYNPKMGKLNTANFPCSRLEEFSLDGWNQDLSIGLTGAFLCSQIIGGDKGVFGGQMHPAVKNDLFGFENEAQARLRVVHGVQIDAIRILFAKARGLAGDNFGKLFIRIGQFR